MIFHNQKPNQISRSSSTFMMIEVGVFQIVILENTS